MRAVQSIHLILLLFFGAFSFVGGRVFPRSPELLSRQDRDSPCQPQCAPDRCGGAACTLPLKRSLEYLGEDFNQSSLEFNGQGFLLSRTLSDTDARDGNLGRYLTRHNVENAAVEGLCEGNGNSLSYCTQHAFATVPTDRTTYVGTKNTELTGCTVLTVVSARAVYMCHFWETIAFDQDQRGGPPPDFQGNVINMIRGQTPLYQAYGPALDVNLYNEQRDNTWAFISTPRVWQEQGTTRTPMFANQINTLVATIRQLIPGVGVVVRPYEKPQDPDENGIFQYPADKPYLGQALFEFDPLADGRYGADWRLWYEEASERGRRIGQQID